MSLFLTLLIMLRREVPLLPDGDSAHKPEMGKPVKVSPEIDTGGERRV